MIKLRKNTIPMMLDLMENMNRGVNIKEDLITLLDHPDYQVELERYLNHRPDVKFTKDEFVEFFINIKSYPVENDLPRGLKFRREDLIEIMDHIPYYRKIYENIQDIDDGHIMEALKKTYVGLPKGTMINDMELIFNIGIGMSGGYIYKQYTQYDLKKVIGDRSRQSLMNTIAHESHHMGYNQVLSKLNDEKVLNNLDAGLLVYLSGEGTAIKYCNNFEGILSKKIYPDEEMDVDDISYDYYKNNFEKIYVQFRKDLEILKSPNSTLEELGQLFMTNYFYTDVEIDGKTVENYLGQPLAYHFGADLWGMIYDVYGTEKVFEVLLTPEKIIETFNAAFSFIGREDLKL